MKRTTRLVVSFAVALALATVSAAAPPGEPGILTPKPSAAPHLNGPRVYGARPGRPFLYRIPCTGERPIAFSAGGLPPSIHLDPATGILSGTTPTAPGIHQLHLTAKSKLGKSERKLRLVVGDKLALTPPMGWNDWYSFYDRVSADLLKQAADTLVESGMADFGYQYVNVDDCWMVKPGATDPQVSGEPRDAGGAIRPNPRFPDMKALTEYIHTRGLKAGLYTSPGPLTCAGFTGSYQHEDQDASRFVEWGFDFLKYDWCSYEKVATGEGAERFQKPYRQMGGILAKEPRDVVFNLCQYGMGDVWDWGSAVGGHSWRTTGDLGLEKAGRNLPGFYSVAFANARHAASAGPGAWNDPDYILIGQVGDPNDTSAPPKPTNLTQSEQYSYLSLWSLMAAPLFYSGDITHLDPFTLNVLCNSEVIEVDQDPLGKQARVVRGPDGPELVMARPLEDGSLAVGLFALSDSPRTITVSWEELGLTGPQQVRDLWRQDDVGVYHRRFEAAVSRHGVALVRLLPSR
ncbi:MAG TPA: putative Ig domain-containing protein [Vicinamibacteria bacterium]|nr:putative Ig domain-containing protein [Vicinamibacteria bacterium]